METLEVRGAPEYYVCKEGILDSLNEFLLKQDLKYSFILHGEKSWEHTSPFFPSLPTTNFEKYNGECSLEEIERVSKIVRKLGNDHIIGIGGGKILDLAKAVGNECSLSVILVPTLPSTCAAWTPLSVIYSSKGEYISFSIHRKSTLAVFLEPRILLSSPSEYLKAGIGDTLAKWYEADAITRQENFLPVPVQAALESARLCKGNLLDVGHSALLDHENNQLTKELIQVFETIIVLGGMVGGFGDRFGRIAGAHSIHNGITQLPNMHHILHGEKVAYGILVQLMLENQSAEISTLLPHYKKWNLPYNLDSLGIKKHNLHTSIKTIAEFATLPNESIHLIRSEINANIIVEAILSLENLVNENFTNYSWYSS